MSISTAPTAHWFHACRVNDIAPWTGVAALFSRTQIALIRFGQSESIYALGNFDPFSKAYVISRGIVGDVGGDPTVASPVYKQHFRLSDGVCIEDAAVVLPTYPTRIEHGDIFVAIAPVH